jgi:hypothetical protein
MAVTQDVIIRVIYESDLKDGIKEVEQLGTAAKKDIDVFKSLSKEISLGMNDALKEAGVSSKQLADAVTKAGKSGEGFKSLKVQIREARDEAQRLTQAFGDSSIEAKQAATKVATLTDELDDFNNRVKALNPEAKFKAFGQVAQGGIGALQGLTGAMQIFGSENEEVNKIIQKFQGFINVTQGIESIAGLSDSFKSLKVILGLTTVSQTALAAATEGEAAAATQAAIANKGFALSLTATGIGAIVVAIGLLIGAWMAYANSQDEATEAAERFAKSQKKFEDEFSKLFKKNKDTEIERLEHIINLKEINGASDRELLQLEKEKALYQIAANNKALENNRIGKENRAELKADNVKLNYLVEEYNAKLALSPKLLKDTQKSTKDLAEEQRKFLEERNAGWIAEGNRLRSLEKQYNDEVALAQKKEKDLEELRDAQRQYELAQTTKQEEAKLAILRKAQDEYEASEQQKKDIQLANTELALQGAADLSNQLNAMSQQDADIKIANLDRQLQAGLISEKEYATQVTQIKRKQAEQDKKVALFNAAIGIAQAIINALAVAPAPNIAAAALASVLGAAQLATIASRPIPQFNKGTLSVDGVDTGKDSVLAMLRPKEAVIPVDMKQAYLPTLQAMFDGSIKPSELNAMVTQKRTGKTNKSDNGLAELGHIFKSNKSTSIKNADELANKIADAIARKANIRWNL